MDEDSLLADYDLSAWEAPPPPAGLADAVVRRAREPLPRVVPAARSVKWWFVGGGSLAAVGAILAIMMWGVERAPKNGRGEVRASAPRSLDLGTSSATIDDGAQVTWRREGTKLTVSQPRGAATWTVGGQDTLVIDAGAMVASVEASGASLRVEVEMNRSDVRAMGIGSASAIVVALVTVIVYEGHVKATSNGQTVNIQPGASMQFGPPARAPPTPEQLSVGGGPQDAARIKELEAEVARLKRELAAKDAKDPDKRDCDQAACTPDNYDPVCCTGLKTVGCDADGLKRKGDDFLTGGMDASALAQFELSLKCKHDPNVVKVAFLAACRSKNATKARLYYKQIPAANQSNYTQLCLRVGIDPRGAVTTQPDVQPDEDAPPACDADAAKKKGEDYLAGGMDAAALAQFEVSLRCKSDPNVMKTAFLAACRSKNPTKAKLYFGKVPPSMQLNYAQICLRFGITLGGGSSSSSTSPVASTGTLRISSQPAAKIEIDGVAVGTTPLTKDVPAGKHKVTFVVGGDKYTYAVTVKAGEVSSLTKDLKPNPY